MTQAPAETMVARLSTDRPTAHRLADALFERLDPDNSAVSLYEAGILWTVEAAFHDVRDRAVIADTIARTAGAEAAERLEFSAVETRDWVAASLAGLAPVRAGRFVVHGAHDRTSLRPNEIGIEIEAALAFGTGHHGTTRGCLLAFEALRKQARNSQRWRILDVGTGTGILAIAAALALHRPVTASDVDPAAIVVARENTRLNHAVSLVQALVANGVDSGPVRGAAPYDLIFANILEAPLRRMSAAISALLAPEGRLILSGLLPAHAPGVIAAYRQHGLRLDARLTLDGWVTLTMRRGRGVPAR